MSSRWAVVIRGMSTPFVIDCTSRIALVFAGSPVVFTATDCASRAVDIEMRRRKERGTCFIIHGILMILQRFRFHQAISLHVFQ
jgi:hypothetical protein